MANEPLRAAFIGCGRHATQSLYPALRLAPFELVACCDLDEALARRNARWFGAERWYTDHRRMLDREQVDAVLICVGPRGHAPLAIEVLERGLPVFVEKPPAVDSAACEAVVTAAQRAGKLVQVGFMKRFATAYVMARQAIADEASFGRPLHISAKYVASRYPSTEAWLLDYTIHPLDLMRHFMGDVERLHVEAVEAGPGRMGLAVALRFRSGAVGLLNTSSLQSWGEPDELVEITGDGRWIRVENRVRFTYYRGAPRIDQRTAAIDVERDALVWEPNWTLPAGDTNGSLVHQGYVGELQHFVRCLRGEAQPLATIEDGLAALRLVEEVARQALAGRQGGS